MIARIFVPRSPERLSVSLPYRSDNREWILGVCGLQTRPEWDPTRKVWSVARTHLNTLVPAAVDRCGIVELLRAMSSHQRCDTRCQDATGWECECICGGANHGTGAYQAGGWLQVGDTTLFREEDAVKIYRTIIRRSDPQAPTSRPRLRSEGMAPSGQLWKRARGTHPALLAR